MKIFCIGRNYREHAIELGNEIPEEPVIFIKPKSALLNANFPFIYPGFTNELHYEGELVFRVCKNGKFIDAYDAFNYVDAITIGIDFTARDIQTRLKQKGLPWEKAKAFDNSAVVGTFIPFNMDMLEQGIDFSLRLNKAEVQNSNSDKMITNLPLLIENISQYFTLNIGDLIFTGTPEGVGECSVTDLLEGYIGNQKLLNVNIK
jgi:2-keto-4-pentenoate hydratase/2-oxohepta-3-ene-1,7-dioic acid hydratase in catechol pathway